MAQRLKELRNELRAERCPPVVMDRVREVISQERRRQRMQLLRWAAAGCALLAMLSIQVVHWSRQQAPASVSAAKLNEAKAITEQTQLALSYVGQTLNQAGSKSRDIILEVSLPRLRQGLRKASEAISIPNKDEPETN